MPSLPSCLTAHFYPFTSMLFPATFNINSLPFHLLSSSQPTLALLSLIDKLGNLNSLSFHYISMHFISIILTLSWRFHVDLRTLVGYIELEISARQLKLLQDPLDDLEKATNKYISLIIIRTEITKLSQCKTKK